MTLRSDKLLLGLLIFFLLATNVSAQVKHFNIQWDRSQTRFPGNFEGAQSQEINQKEYYLIWVHSENTGTQRYDVSLINPVYEKFTTSGTSAKKISTVNSLDYINGDERGTNRLIIKVLPYKVTGESIERLVSFDLKYTLSSAILPRLNKKGNKTQSVLSSGDWYKIKVKEDGAYKIDRSFLVKQGINPENIELSTFKIYGNGIGMLPEVISETRADDLVENSVRVNDINANNRWDEGDYVLFYGKGPDIWKPNAIDYNHVKNVFSDFTCYFFTWGGAPGKRISQNSDGIGVTPDKVITESDYLFLHETETFNFRNSGREWFGEVLTIENASFNIKIPDYVGSSGNFIRSEAAIRTGIATVINVYLNGNFNTFHSGGAVNFESDDNYADVSNIKINFGNLSDFNLLYEFRRPQLSSEAWLNYFEVQAKRKLKPIDGQIILQNIQSINNGKIKYLVEDLTTDYTFWDVTDPTNIYLQNTFSEAGKSAFIVNPNGVLMRYLVFKNGSELQPEAIGKVENQNMHALQPADFIIVSHPEFKTQAEKLAKFHADRDGYSYLIVYPEKIYNEFSSGMMDITAIRDFVKMLYDRADVNKKPKALLLFGDASFDYKNRNNSNANLVPTFESYEYNNSISSYCSDDYYVILGDFEGYWPKLNVQELLDMGVGRLPAKSEYEAEVMVDKCIQYKTLSNKGEWRSSISFLGDDEDDDIHFRDSERLGDVVENEFPPFNVNKIYFDAYKQVSLGNGNAYPDVNEAINNAITKGTLVFNYLGHGGGSGMGHERVVTRPQILAWKNYDRLCFFVTGTCDLAQFDNPKEESPGELMMINDQGGAIGMMTTTRKVYIGTNTSFSEVLFKKNLFAKSGKGFMPFGQAYANVKNVMWGTPNVRNYVMFGDPLLDLNIPVEKTIITSINGKTVTSLSHDTLKALSKVEIEGNVTDNSGNILSDFNGDASITLFDKKQTYKTLANDPASSVLAFTTRNNVLYRGKVSVSNGSFKVSFILPKDIDYAIGSGRIFTYAYNDKTDAVGIYDSVLVGGTAVNLSLDNQGPQIQVFLEDESFVNGGIVSKNPLLIVKLWDENGINTAGSGVGREILGTLDKESKTSRNYVLNDFYSSTLNSFQGGEVRIPLSELSAGSHTLVVRAWDVFNNSSENEVEFLVATDENFAIRNLLNYPNPFVNKTKILFDHNKAGQELKVSVNIMSVSGKVVKSLYSHIPVASSHFDNLEWDGKDEFGQNLAKGVYLYQIKVQSEDGKTAEEIQKMVLLK